MRESGTVKEPSKLLLLGNPNAGKSTLFNALTGGHARVGNWHGVTVSALEGEALLAGNRVKIADLPGAYSADGLGMEERAACAYLKEHPEGAPPQPCAPFRACQRKARRFGAHEKAAVRAAGGNARRTRT